MVDTGNPDHPPELTGISLGMIKARQRNDGFLSIPYAPQISQQGFGVKGFRCASSIDNVVGVFSKGDAQVL